MSYVEIWIRNVKFLFNFCSKYRSKYLLEISVTWFFPEMGHFFELQNSKMILNSNFEFRRKNEFETKMIRILSHLQLFQLKKVSQFGIFDTWSIFQLKIKEKLNGSNFSHQNHMDISTCDISYFDVYLSFPSYKFNDHIQNKSAV